MRVRTRICSQFRYGIIIFVSFKWTNHLGMSDGALIWFENAIMENPGIHKLHEILCCWGFLVGEKVPFRLGGLNKGLTISNRVSLIECGFFQCSNVAYWFPTSRSSHGRLSIGPRKVVRSSASVPLLDKSSHKYFGRLRLPSTQLRGIPRFVHCSHGRSFPISPKFSYLIL